MDGDSGVTLQEARETLGNAITLCQLLGWVDLEAQASRILRKAEAGERGDAMKALADDFNEAFTAKASLLQIMIPDDRDSDLIRGGSKSLCGGRLHGDLAISEEELNLAGKAFAFGLSTASVVHAMRSVEASLHMLAKQLNVSFPTPIGLQDWAVITEKIKSEISKAEKLPRSETKSVSLKTLSGLLLAADCFRLAWRNHVAHAREKYEAEEARGILQHVGEFLKRLSDAIPNVAP